MDVGHHGVAELLTSRVEVIGPMKLNNLPTSILWPGTRQNSNLSPCNIQFAPDNLDFVFKVVKFTLDLLPHITLLLKSVFCGNKPFPQVIDFFQNFAELLLVEISQGG